MKKNFGKKILQVLKKFGEKKCVGKKLKCFFIFNIKRKN